MGRVSRVSCPEPMAKLTVRTMYRYLPLAIAAACLGACVTPPDPDAVAELDAVSQVNDVEAPAEISIADAVVITRPPGVCEVLYEQLTATQTAFEQLEGRLDDQNAQLAEAVAKLGELGSDAAPMECPTEPGALPGGKELIGGLEWIYMDPPKQHFRARVDSGAETSSLSARDIVEFERDGEDWVRFVFEHDNANDPVELELPIVREALIRQASSDGLDRRVVVEIDLRLGDRLQRTEFTLTDRRRMTYPVLLGRAFLMDLYVVDVSQSYTHPRYRGP